MFARFISIVRRFPWMGGVGAVLLLVLAVTGIARWAALRQVDDHPDERRQEIVREALGVVEQRFTQIKRDVRDRARQLASDSVVVQGLQTWTASGERSPAMVHRILNFPTDERTTVEVYSPLPRALVWNGRRLPLGEAPNSDRFLDGPQMAIVEDGQVRRALIAWWPVQVGGETIGAIRVARIIRYAPPVRNRYIQGFSLHDEWVEATGESLRIRWEEPLEAATSPQSIVLHGLRDAPLGVVSVNPPDDDRLRQRTAKTYANLLAAWVILLAGWGGWIALYWYSRLARRTGVYRSRSARTGLLGRFACVAVLWIAVRYLLLALEIPARWIEPGSVLAPLFDPTHFASTLGGGLFQSIGDLFLTGLWVFLLGGGLLHVALRFRYRAASFSSLVDRIGDRQGTRPSVRWFLSVIIGGSVVTVGSVFAVAYVVRRSVLDSTLDFFSRTGLLPDPLVFLVLCALFFLLAAVLVAGVGVAWISLRLAAQYQPRWSGTGTLLAVGTVLLLGIAGAYLAIGRTGVFPLPYVMATLLTIGGAALYGMIATQDGAEILTVRGLLLSLFVATLLLYPLLYGGMDAQRRARMVEAAQTFEEGYDPRVLYSLRQVLRAADDELAPLLSRATVHNQGYVDSVATRLVRRSLLASLTTYDMSVSLVGEDGQVLRRYTASGQQSVSQIPHQVEREVFKKLHRVYTRQLSPGPVIDRLAANRIRVRGAERYQYAGLLYAGTDDQRTQWILIRAEPRSLLPGTGPGVPSVLLPGGTFSDLYAELSLAEFQNRTLVRSFGQSFGRTRLVPTIQSALHRQSTVWRSEVVRGRQYLTYYYRPARSEEATVAVRIPSVQTFDHLYYLLRLMVAGLGVVLPIYLCGLYGRYLHGRLPAPRVRFRDKVLNAFLSVGIVSVAAVGVVGVQVVTGEKERVVERRLRDHLTRVEETLALEARSGEPLWQVAARMDVDSLAARVGLDLRLYDDGYLMGTSRPRLVRDGLVDERLPGSVYHAIHDEAYRFRAAPASIGSFRYMVGYQALVDEAGEPRLVVGVPTLAQQEQVAEEQARTLAYLFGALLVLLVVVMFTAVILANALAQPIARLREGLEAVGEGRYARALPVETRDEIGDLVRTFNEMRAQLAESRRKLAQQEREIAWREMARQVAHEIKNPLTPMKLSIQHLRRAFKRADATDSEEDSKFAEMFDRITSTLIEQIDSLVRIADEFSTFARLPTRVLEPINVNEVIREAVQLMEGEVDGDVIEMDGHSEPLVVEADREELRRTFINLLKNAVQAIPDDRSGCVRVTTDVTEVEGQPMVRSQVIDNGTGISPDVQDKIFEPNFSTKTSGTGLGLAIAKKSIDELGGTIGYETTEGEGTTFWVLLPMAEESGATAKEE